MPAPNGKLVTLRDSGTGSSAFLFQPEQLVPFQQAWDLQRCWQERLLLESDNASDADTEAEAVWLLQHPSCYTLGRGASQDHLLFDPEHPPAPLHRIDRGGEVTHHAPGQLVAYPVLDLRRRRTDLHWYLRQLEQVVIDVLQRLGLQGERIEGLTGVWLDQQKVAAIGVGCRRWITQHGLALNVTCDLEGFESVVPCGLKGRSVGRLCDWIPDLEIESVQPLLRDALAARFDLVWQQRAAEQL
ncbi:lipoyl(octanoyl) transferase LipB [Synechococcus sp. GEYO]|uniref:lipoyl(octanoyl) transferase LipB n=1 Tax=Synechococcus sp. GEYO TaxID=2575511 RepID=UPI001FCA982F|nr:lipoyl(octanoyl) transferase LipB [Synechococcus sp. GEYO]